MDAINTKISDGMKQHKYQFRTVSIAHLSEIQNAIGDLVREGTLDEKLAKGWQFYRDNNTKLPEAKTIIIAAASQVAVRLNFKYQGVNYYADVPSGYYKNAEDNVIKAIFQETIEAAGYKTTKARLALKTLAVRSGLAQYGKNNITYIPGMGSFHRLTAFYTDLPFEEDHWEAPQVMQMCKNCTLCRDNCPTGCIPGDRFLIHGEKCLTYLNEESGNFPVWVKPEWHNAIIGCNICQKVCPVNKQFLTNVETGPTFSEEETELILDHTPEDMLSIEIKKKLGDLIEDGYCSMLGRNLMVLIEKQKKSRQ